MNAHTVKMQSGWYPPYGEANGMASVIAQTAPPLDRPPYLLLVAQVHKVMRVPVQVDYVRNLWATENFLDSYHLSRSQGPVYCVA